MTEKERRIKSDLTRLDASDVSSADYDDAPELSDDQLAEAVVAPAARGRGRPPIPSPKVPVKIRLDAAVLEGYRATGPGWQTRINDVLGRALSVKTIEKTKKSSVVGTRKSAKKESSSVSQSRKRA